MSEHPNISNPEELAVYLYSQDVISKEICDEVIKRYSSHGVATRLVAAVKKRILGHCYVLDKFLSILREHPSLAYLSDAMSDLCRK